MNDEHPVGLLPDYSVEALPPAQARQVEQHLERCPACRARLETLRTTATLLRALPEPALPRSFALTERQAPAAPRHPWRLPAGFLSAAAVLFLALGLSFASLGHPAQRFSAASRAAPVAAVQSAAATTSAEAAASIAASSGPAPRGAAAAAAAPPVASASQAAASTSVRPLAAARPAPQGATTAENASAADGAQARAPAVAGQTAASSTPVPTAPEEQAAVAPTPALLQGIRLALAIAAVLCLLVAVAALRRAAR